MIFKTRTPSPSRRKKAESHALVAFLREIVCLQDEKELKKIVEKKWGGGRWVSMFYMLK